MNANNNIDDRECCCEGCWSARGEPCFSCLLGTEGALLGCITGYEIGGAISTHPLAATLGCIACCCGLGAAGSTVSSCLACCSSGCNGQCCDCCYRNNRNNNARNNDSNTQIVVNQRYPNVVGNQIINNQQHPHNLAANSQSSRCQRGSQRG